MLILDFSEAESHVAQFALTPDPMLGNRLALSSLVCVVLGIKSRFYACLANTLSTDFYSHSVCPLEPLGSLGSRLEELGGQSLVLYLMTGAQKSKALINLPNT